MAPSFCSVAGEPSADLVLNDTTRAAELPERIKIAECGLVGVGFASPLSRSPSCRKEGGESSQEDKLRSAPGRCQAEVEPGGLVLGRDRNREEAVSAIGARRREHGGLLASKRACTCA